MSGNNQQGKAGERLAEPLVVQVRNARGDGLGHVGVTFTVTSGGGAWRWDEHGAVTTTVVATNAHGLAGAFFIPTVLGTSTVAAAVEVAHSKSVTFSTSATIQVIHFVYWGWGRFWEADVSVPIGTPVEWTQPYSRTPYTVISMSAPAGGRSFSSGVLDPGERFHFVPRVAGTWEYFDRISGATATLTARE